MLEAPKKIIMYKAFGLNISCDVQFPELTIKKEQVDSSDIEITGIYGNSFPVISSSKYEFIINKDEVIFHAPNTATFLIEKGKRIIYKPIINADMDLIRLYILGTCMGILLMQRKIIPLHGSAVVIEGKVYAFVGDSGAGKSTLASAFIKSGYQLISDDIVPISLSDENLPIVTPSYPQQKLWHDSLKKLKIDSSNYRSIYGRENKFCVPVSNTFCTRSLPLGGIFELIKDEVINRVEINSIQKLERLSTLFRNTYRNFLIPEMGLTEWHFNSSTKILNDIDFYRLNRPSSRCSTHEIVSLILGNLNKGE
ncbi:aldolase [Cytobacillus sp. S13-E01]|uniref:aldolase n=1 Tax=Cytobacillus sp. S13-E01 TaxID=3031326 RepID=UPI0023D8472E|nr:aldolase [Cytobacillus sp. S13-E01]MDF0727754.1 aldolase [Cytobacillus sp. S13-E01]